MAEALVSQEDWALAAEAGLIGAMMFNPNWFERLTTAPTPDDFLAPAHAELWREIILLREEGKTCDAMALRRVVEAMPQYFQIEGYAGVAYLAYLFENASFWPECNDYAGIVVDRSHRRALQISAAGLISDLEQVRSAPVALDRLKETLAPLEASIAKCVDDGSIDPQEVFAPTAENSLFKTGIVRLDQDFRGFQRGLMSVIGGAPAMGKTALVIQMTVNAIRRGETVGMFTLDMSKMQVWQRVGCCVAFEEQMLPVHDIPTYGELADRPLSKEQRAALEGAVGKARNILVNEASRLTVEDIERQITAWQLMLKKQGRPPLSAVFIDHLGQVDAGLKTSNPYETTSRASNKLLAMSKRLKGLATIVVVQLNRSARQEKRRPMAHDMRDSGRIEEDANGILLVHRDEWYLNQQLKTADADEERIILDKLKACEGNMDIVIAKNRVAQTGVVVLDHMIQYNHINAGGRL